MNQPTPWSRYNQWTVRHPELGISLDVSRINFEDAWLSKKASDARKAFEAMKELEAGSIANPDEERMVGHYWLRNPSLAPDPALKEAIEKALSAVKQFATDIHDARIKTPEGGRFRHVLVVGIGGSALGPQFTADALWSPTDPMDLWFLDNTDPDGMDKIFAQIDLLWEETLVVVISKSGGTKETRNGMVEVKNRLKAKGLDFAKRAVAITGDASELDKTALAEGWLKRFPMWDWVGGRTSIMSTVGLVPAALQGWDIEAFLAGAAAMDEWTRSEDHAANPAMLLALMWLHAGHGKGERDMVVLPYKDRLVLFSKYLQQLVMESLGKEKDLDGKTVRQGIAVYGNKGSTDQHAYVQQLRDGVNNFFVTFIEIRKGRAGERFEVEPGITSADYLQGFLRGTRTALSESGRESITLSLPAVTAGMIGALIALFERAVGFYATLVHINAYHQPGVEAGKKAAGEVLTLQKRVLAELSKNPTKPVAASDIAQSLEADAEQTYHVLMHLASNHPSVQVDCGTRPSADRFFYNP